MSALRSLRVVALAALAAATPARAELPDAQTAMRYVGFSDAEIAQAKAGQIVRRTPEAASERELTTAMGFLVKAPPSDVMAELEKGLLVTNDPGSLASGAIAVDGSTASLPGFELGADEVKTYAGTGAGDRLNLSAQEIAALAAAPSGDSSALEKLVQEQLLARHGAYRQKGLAGIAPYDRGDGDTRSAGDELRTATRALEGFEKYVPEFQKVMLEYPKAKPAGFKERYDWRKIDAHGDPTLALTHYMWMPSGGGFAAAQRQFYVSRGFNAEQAVAALLPVKSGTAVVYVNRTSTDQVAGFGGGTKRSLGSKLLASQLETLFEHFQRDAAN